MALAGVASQAGAAVITTDVQSIYFGTHMTEFDSSSPAQNYATQVFSLFDTNLGTLLSVSIRATYQESSSLRLTNTGATTAKGSANSRSDLFLDASDDGQDAVISALLNPSGNAVSSLGATVNYNGTNGIAAGTYRDFTSNAAAPTDTNYKTDSLAQDIASFAAAGGGTGSVIANTQTYTTTTYTGGNLQSSQTTQGTPTFFIYYTYDDATAAVPEPGTWLMMILGFGAIGIGLRRRGSNLVLG